MHIRLEFKVERRLGDPMMRIMVDDTTSSFDGPCVSEIEFDVPLTVGDHELRITHYGKTNQDHVFDNHGNVIIDKHFEISKIYFDNVELIEELWDGVFYPVYNEDYIQDLQSQGKTISYSIKPNLYLGHNGTWQLQFQYPVIDWLIDQRQYRLIKVQDPDFLSHERELQEVKQWFLQAPELDWTKEL